VNSLNVRELDNDRARIRVTNEQTQVDSTRSSPVVTHLSNNQGRRNLTTVKESLG